MVVEINNYPVTIARLALNFQSQPPFPLLKKQVRQENQKFAYSKDCVDSIPLTASHSSKSSPSGSFTTFLKLPLPKVCSAYLLS